jgi:protein-tyrosine kinase
MAQHFHAGRRALAVCAASPGVGCSFVASNLALALSQIGMRTLLVDANLRFPSLHSIFGESGRVAGLADCLATEDGEFGSYVHAGEPNLSMIYAGGVPANSQELLAGRRFHDLLKFCLREFGDDLGYAASQYLRRRPTGQFGHRLQPDRRAARPRLRR